MKLTVIAGTDASFPLQMRAGGVPYTGCAAGDTFNVALWAGGSRLPISPAPTAQWIDAPSGTFRVVVARTVTPTLEPGEYSLEVDVVRTASASGLIQPAFRGELEIIGVPGTSPAPPEYCTDADLREFYPEITKLQKGSDQAGFERARATAWASINNYWWDQYNPVPGMCKRRYTSIVPGSGLGLDRPDTVTVPPTKDELQAALVAGGLVLGAIDGPILRRIAASLSIAEVLASKEAGNRNANPYAESADGFRTRAMLSLREFHPYVDMDSPLDGVADIQLCGRNCVFLDGWPAP